MTGQIVKAVLLVGCFVSALCASVVAQQTRDELFLIKVNGKIGFMDSAGRVRIEPRFNAPIYVGRSHEVDVVWFADERAPVFIQGKWGYIDRFGRIAIKPQFSEASSFVGNRASICVPHTDSQDEVGRRCGIIDRTGAFVTEPIYEDPLYFGDGLARVEAKPAEGWTRFVAEDGSLALEVPYDVDYFNEGLARVETGSSDSSFIDRAGQVAFVLKNKRTDIHFSEGLITFNEVEGVADGESPCGVRESDLVTRRLRPARPCDLVGYLDKSGKVVIAPRFQSARDFREGLAAIADADGKWGFIDKTGKVVIAPRFEHVESFSEGLAVFSQDDKYGYIDKTGRVVIEPRFAAAGRFLGGLAAVSDDIEPACGMCPVVVTKWRTLGYINRDGKYVWQPTK